MNLTDFLKQTLERLKAYSPDYFIKLRKIAGWITAITFLISYLPQLFIWFQIPIVFSETMLTIIAVSGRLWQYLAVVFGISWLPVDQGKEAKYFLHDNVYLKKTGEKLLINNIIYDKEYDTKTGKDLRFVKYVCSNNETYYEVELTDQEPTV
jgi:hypothetical protein